jgi:uncharacterized protein
LNNKNMPNHILITGGTGMIGTRLTDLLISKGYNVAHLGRTRTGREKIKTYTWQISKNVIEAGAIENADYIIHLAGANIGAKRWTESRKEELEKSRTESSYLLYQKLRLLRHKVKAVICASAIGYYGLDNSNLMLTEESPPGDDFLSNFVVKWEDQVNKIRKLKLRMVQFRAGPVLSKEGGMLKKILPIAKAGMSAPIGSGNQYISWIHIDDICQMYLKAIEDKSMEGVYNAVAPNPVTNREFMKSLAKAVKRPFILPPVPTLALKLMYGEMAQSVLGSTKVSSSKIESAGFVFTYPHLDGALENLLKKK